MTTHSRLTLALLLVGYGPVLGAKDGTLPYPVIRQTTVSKPLSRITTPKSGTSAGRLSKSLAPQAPQPVLMRLLVLTATSSEASCVSITTFLSQLGVPYQTVVLSALTPDDSGNRLNGLTLSDSISGQGLYQGIILTSGNLSGMLSAADWQKLDSYAAGWAVRVVSYYTLPEARYGLVPVGNGQLYTDSAPLEVGFTDAAASVFPYLNRNSTIAVGSSPGVFAYLASATAASGETTTPILTAGANTVGAIHVAADGRETLALTMDNDPALLHSTLFNYGVISWVTKGVFLGSRQIYLPPQIDDMLAGDVLYAPALPACPDAGPEMCPAVFTTGSDLATVAGWQTDKRSDQQFSNFRISFSYVGIGVDPPPAGYEPANDTLSPMVTALASQFNWVSHTYSHPNLDCYSLSNSTCIPANSAQSLAEIDNNLRMARTLGIPNDASSMVTPGMSGLNNLDFLEAALERGVRNVIIDIAYTGLSGPNTGITNSLVPSIVEIPRRATNLFDDVSSPTSGVNGSLVDEYNALYGPSGIMHVFNQNQTYSQILENESSIILVNMLHYEPYPLSFHIANMAPYQGSQSLFTDLMDRLVTKYKALSTLPVTSPSMTEIGAHLIDRAKYDASGVTGVYTPGVSVVLTTSRAANVPVTGACSQAACPTFGGEIQDTVPMTAGSSVTLLVNAQSGASSLVSLSVSPLSFAGGISAVGTVMLNGPAPAGGAVVSLASDNGAAIVPASVTIAAGNTVATFTVSTPAATVSTVVTLTATLNGISRNSTVTITPAALTSVALNPTTVVGGNLSTGTLTLSGAAPAGGIVVSLESGNNAVIVPANVTVEAGNLTATFPVTSTAVATATTATLTATYNGVSKTATLTINPAVSLSSVALNPTTVHGGTPSTGTLTLTGAAPAGGILISLASDNSAAIVPANVLIEAGNLTATFPITSTAVTTATTATLTATYNNISKTATLTINPAVALFSMTLNPTTVVAGSPSTGTVTLTGAAPAGGILVSLSSDKTAATVPASVIVEAGDLTATFPITSTAITTATTATLTATYNSISKTATLTINPAVALSSMALNPTTVVAGNPSTGTVTLTGAAPAGGILVSLSSDKTAATVPASVIVEAGNLTATFPITSTAVTTATSATLTATYNGISKTATLTINPAVALSSMVLNPTIVVAGSPSTGTLTLTGAAPAGGILVLLSGDKPAATVPANVLIEAGNLTATFPITSTAVTAATTATLTATYNGISKTATLTINPAVALSSMTLNPTTVVGGNPSTGTLTLTGAAPAGGILVLLSSDKATATVPGNVLVTAGSATATFTVTTKTVTGSSSAALTASYGGVSKTTKLAINPALPSPPPIPIPPSADKGTQIITFPEIPSHTTDDAAFNITATSSSGLTVMFTIVSGPATISGNTVTLTGPGTVVVQADQAGNSSIAAAPAVQRSFEVSLPLLKVGAILNGASYANSALASGAYASIFGSAFATQTIEASQQPYPAQLGGVTIAIIDSAGITRSGALSYISPTQINFVLPPELSAGPAAVLISNGAKQSSTYQVRIASVAPALFTGDSSGKGAAAAFYIVVRPDGSQQTSRVSNCSRTPLVCVPNSVDLGSSDTSVYVSLYGTGIRGRTTLEGVSVHGDGIPLQVTYAGAQATYPGLDQVNVLLDRALAGRGQIELQLTVDGVPANPVTINVD